MNNKNVLAIIAVIAIIGAGVYFTRPKEEVSQKTNTSYSKKTTTMTDSQKYDAPPQMALEEETDYKAIIKTEHGEMHFDLFETETPITVNNFVFLANEGFYNNTVFHRVIEDFMAQGGDPTGTGTGGPGYRFEDEVDTGRSFDKRGLLAMANAGPGTNGSQFFITFEPTPWLTGNHTIFGELTKGDDVLSKITVREPGSSISPDVIKEIQIVKE